MKKRQGNECGGHFFINRCGGNFFYKSVREKLFEKSFSRALFKNFQHFIIANKMSVLYPLTVG
jgi:hypothetical protein